MKSKIKAFSKKDSYHYFEGPSIKFSEETFASLKQLGEILQGIHQDMLDQGYEIIDGKISKTKTT